MILAFAARLRRPLKILNDDELQDIHSATLDVLENVGVKFGEENALRILNEAGADVDPKTSLVKLPSFLVEEAIKRCPRKIKLYGRTDNHDLTLGDGRVYFTAGANALYIHDLETGQRRTPTSKDCGELTRVCDALEYAHVILPVVVPQDVPQDIADRVKCKISYENTEKHYWCDVYGRDSAIDLIRMAAAVAGGMDELRRRPVITINPGVTSPLMWSKTATEAILECARHGVPQLPDCMPNAGATSPVTLAGSVVQQNAENLSFITLAQSASPGTPAYGYSSPGITNMRTGSVVYGAVEVAIQSVAMSQIYSWYGIPYATTVGLTDSKIHDEQAAYERATAALLAALGGPSMISTQFGAVNSLIDASYEQTMIDDEIAGMISRALSGVQVNEETMAVDLIAKVGPGGHYLGQRHTKDLFLKEHYLPRLADRNSRDKWKKEGAKDIAKRARERAEEILRAHQPAPLEDDVRKELDDIIEEARRRRLSHLST